MVNPVVLAFSAAVGLAVLFLVLDYAYSRRVRARAAARPPRPRIEPFLLNGAGRPALLLIHGFTDTPSVFAQLAPPLAAAGFAVRAMRLSGSGVPPAEMHGTTFAGWRGEIDREIAALRAADPARPVWLVGHSLGGALAFDAALRPANRIAGLVLLAPLIAVSRARSPLLSPRQWFHLLDRLLVFSRVVESRLPADLHDPAARAAYRTDKFIHRDIYRAVFAAIAAVEARAADWPGPLFMAVADADQIVDAPAARRFFAAARARPAELLAPPGAGHVLPLDHGHARLADAVRRFIQAAPALPP